MRRRVVTAAIAGLLLVAGVLPAARADAAPAEPVVGSAAALVAAIPDQYRQAAIAHDAGIAARLRAETALLAGAPLPVAARTPLTRLAAQIGQTREELQPWPTADDVARTAAAAQRTLGAPLRPDARPYDAVRAALDRAGSEAAAGDHATAVADGLRAYALAGPLLSRLGTGATGLQDAFWSRDAARPGLLSALAGQGTAGAHAAADRAGSAVDAAQQSLGDVTVSRGTVVTDAAILVFREGLEAVLILAAITASFVGARRHLRRPVLIGGLLGIVATAITWILVQLLVSELGTGGLRLEAITGVLAIAVLLVVTNWFFHRVYWSSWIARFNRRRKSLERLDKVGLGFLSGQAVALGVLGLTSVYREGFETVLFLQNLQVSAGTAACLLGAGIGLAGTLAVGVTTFLAQRKLPYKRMLIATGVLIAVVLAVMTGTTVHVLQGLGWLPSTATGGTVPLWCNRWLGIYATWEGMVAQVGALAVVLGSYVVAREFQVARPRRRAAREGALSG